MTNIVHTVHHFEDEPQNVDWIPGSLFNCYRLEHPEWFQPTAGMKKSQKDHLVVFSLDEREPPVTFEYRSYVDCKDFKTRFPGACRPRDLVILDVYVKSNLGVDAEGLEAYAIARETLGEDGAIFFMTAYPSILSERLPAAAYTGKTFAKPIDANEIVDLLIRHFDIAL